MEKYKVKLLVSLSILSLIQFELVKSQCVIEYPTDVETSPIYAKILGKYTLYIPYNGKSFKLYESERIQAFCSTNFSSIACLGCIENYSIELQDQSSISITCEGGNLYVNEFILNENVLKCNKLNWSIYDTNDTYEWCEKNENAKTFLLAAKSNQDHHILAGICFNLNDWSLQTITYNVTNKGYNYNKEMPSDITKSKLKSFQSLGEDLSTWENNIFYLTEHDLQQQIKELTESNSWLNLAKYEISSIVQGDSYENYFNEYIQILQIVWWHNLRLGNWKHFINALENYSIKNNFQIYTGTSGVVKVPAKNSVDILEIKNGFFNKTVPNYIWTYLTSTDNQNEDFIIVGYNSPFAEWFGINDVIFCPDICSEIPWLKEISSSFRYAAAGIMFCCSTDFVRQTNYLHGFPMDVLKERAAQKSTDAIGIENNTEKLLNSSDFHVLNDDVEVNTEYLLDI